MADIDDNKRRAWRCIAILVAFGTLFIVPVSAIAAGGNWYVSDAGTGPWERINGSCVPAYKLRGGDFNGDGKTDVFYASAGKWYVSYGGKSQWSQINKSNIKPDNLRFGDFNGDGKTDVFANWSNKWHISYGGNTKWKTVNSSNIYLYDLRFGDFNNDGKTDVFAKWSNQWRVSLNATSPWMKISKSVKWWKDIGKYDLEFGDYVGDERRDRFKSDTFGCGKPVSGGGTTGGNEPDKPKDKPTCGEHHQPACRDTGCKPGLVQDGTICYACGIPGLACCQKSRSPSSGSFCFKGVCNKESFTCE